MPEPHTSWTVETHEMLMLGTAAGEIQRYRVKVGYIDFQPKRHLPWRRLAPADVLQHVRLKTIMADWLRRRFRLGDLEQSENSLPAFLGSWI